MRDEQGKDEIMFTEGMTLEEYNKLLDKWFAERNKKKGETYIPRVGVLPPDIRVTLQAGLNNEWVTTDTIRHYADAIGDKNPLWRSYEYAKRTRWGSIIAPPTYIDCIAPTFVADRAGMPIGSRPLVAGSKRWWFKPILPGDRFRVIDRYLGIEEKKHIEDRSYRLFIDTTRRTYINQKNEIVAISDAPLIIPCYRTAEMMKSVLPKVTKYRHYTQEELDAIHRAYEEENRRGDEIRYWEDVVAGEELKPIVSGPLDVADNACFLGALGFIGAFGVKWEMIKADPSWAHINPLTGELNSASESHLGDISSMARGGTIGFGYAAQTEGLLSHLITNWMGDDGFLKYLECKSRRPNWLGDTSWMKGKVTKKYVENDEYLVDIEAHAENQEGIIHMPCNATVRLLSRTENQVWSL